jgi:cytochrome o ubiquinol oxidase operon protein cyoD
MSNDSNHGHDAHHHDDGLPHGSMRDYVTGFILSVILTAIPFWLVMARPLEAGVTAALIVAFAVVQVIVHMVYFLHMSPKSDDGWTLTSLIFTVIVVVIMLAGSMWVMHHLNTNMMPTSHDMSQMP